MVTDHLCQFLKAGRKYRLGGCSRFLTPVKSLSNVGTNTYANMTQMCLRLLLLSGDMRQRQQLSSLQYFNDGLLGFSQMS